MTDQSFNSRMRYPTVFARLQELVTIWRGAAGATPADEKNDQAVNPEPKPDEQVSDEAMSNQEQVPRSTANTNAGVCL